MELGIINQNVIDIVPPNIITVPSTTTTISTTTNEPDDYCSVKSANGREPVGGRTVFNVSSETGELKIELSRHVRKYLITEVLNELFLKVTKI